MANYEDISIQLKEALAECERLREENTELKRRWNREHSAGTVSVDSFDRIENGVENFTELSPDAKVALFRQLFRGRDDVYAVRWEKRNGRSGYSPACIRNWNPIGPLSDGNRRMSKHDRDYLPLTDQVVRDHLQGKHIIGIYPLLQDETCRFLTVDFDKRTWEEDVAAFMNVCRDFEVPAVLERSRSGNGGHVWIFFDRPISAALARQMGSALLTRTMEHRHQVGLNSYDRLFPNQDTMPKGGFGNLIALPLQRGPRANGNSVFLNQELFPYSDQWRFLASIKRMTTETVERLVRTFSQNGSIIGVRSVEMSEEVVDAPWLMLPSGRDIDKPLDGPFPETVRVVRGNLLYVEKTGLSSKMINRLVRIAAFQNPEFYRAQSMRLSTFGKPRVISCAEEYPLHIGLPRGCRDELVEFLKSYKISLEEIDERFVGEPIQMNFEGALNPHQVLPAETLRSFDDGIFCAPTAFGKTIVAAWLIAERKVRTLILVHRQQLMDQWRERLAVFLSVSIKEIGQIGGGKHSGKGRIDVAVMQSLYRKGKVNDCVADYGQVIVDECHHISAFSFEQLLKQVKAKYVHGLTATPIRKDGHHPIIAMQCGPIRCNINLNRSGAINIIKHLVISRPTNFSLTPGLTGDRIQDIYSALTRDHERNRLILQDVIQAVEAGRSPLLLTERTEHLQVFETALRTKFNNVFVLRGGLGKKQRAAVLEELNAVPPESSRIIIATGRYIGEGFDDARLDTLFLAMPISWRGTLQQYVGRLHRNYDNKHTVMVYDYIDVQVPMLARMFEKRLKGYRAIGYVLQESE